ncbi:wd repeat-containing protein [Stylonychia lemnae]|uniref:Wd repeat-containing protein n=1 Tax=Stylonychia lemnae TaxID=5949 RepID=A0A078AAP5_STYLE|nr:wd repeat-containing protein [Stylonychia lemnae]|eukprot:CDW78911.1 wd repeat-containing protein [Stylonychia lemnae]
MFKVHQKGENMQNNRISQEELRNQYNFSFAPENSKSPKKHSTNLRITTYNEFSPKDPRKEVLSVRQSSDNSQIQKSKDDSEVRNNQGSEEIASNLKRIIYECEENLKKLESHKSNSNSDHAAANSSNSHSYQSQIIKVKPLKKEVSQRRNSEDDDFFVINKNQDSLLQPQINNLLNSQGGQEQSLNTFVRKRSSNKDNFEVTLSSKMPSQNQSLNLSDKQNALENFEKNLSTKFPGLFQDFSTNQDISCIPKSMSGIHYVEPSSLSIFKTISFNSGKDNTQNSSLNQKQAASSNSSSKSSVLPIPKERTKLQNKTYHELNNLIQVQEIKCGNDAIWVIKFRSDGLYMATGGKDGILRVWKCCQSSKELNQRQTINPVPIREYTSVHQSDIFDVNWSTKHLNIILSASSDFNVLIYNINHEKPLKVLQHPDISDNLLASGCFDKFVRVWDIKNKKVKDWQQTSCYITAIKYTNCGERLYVGLVNGDVVIYDSTQEQLRPLRIVECKNKRGKFSKGRKVTSIDFLTVNIAMITNNDSRIRFIDARNGKQIYKIKAHKNESFPIKASISDDFSHVICGSEDGDLYLWSQIQNTVIQMSKTSLIGKLLLKDKTNSCEYFTPYCKSQPVTAAVFAPEQVKLIQMKRYFKNVLEDKMINMIMVMGNINGLIKIFHNETSCTSPNISPRTNKKFNRLTY